MSHLFPRHNKHTPPLIASGDGVYLIDSNGKRYLDGSGGAAVSCLGHSNAAVKEAIARQLNKVAYAHTSFFTSEAAEQLAATLAAAAPENINRVYPLCGGSEAVEAAIKLARQYFCERGQPQRRHIIAREQSYHGNTLGALAVGGNQWRRRQFHPLLFDGAHHIPACHYWRWGGDGETAEEYGTRVADALEEKILALGADTVAAFVAEPVVGATMGAVTATAGYFRRIRDICDRHGVLLILDEVMCGIGRTGTLFACEQEGITADIICVAKGLGGGMQPLAAMLCDEKIYQTIGDGSGFFQHGHTYHAHSTACAAGVAVLEEIQRQQLLPRVRQMGAVLEAALRQRLGEHPHVGDIRGRGLFWGVEFVADKNSKAPLPAADKTHAAIKRAAFANGLMIYAMGGTIDGINGDHILIAPPYIISEEQVEELVDKVADAVCAVLG